MTNRTRQEEIRAIHKKHRLFYELLGGLVLLLIGIFIGAMFFGGENRDYWMNLFTEGIGVLASIGFTVFIIDRLNAKRDQERQTQDLKDRLVREAGSRSNDIAISAVEQLRAKRWLTGDDGLLQGARLHNANLQGADLSVADLPGAGLTEANLQEAILYVANLPGADLTKANLQRANLAVADLRGAILLAADLRGAILAEAYLQEADLTEANLQEAILPEAYLQEAILYAADLRGADLTEANLQEANLYVAYLRGANLTDANLQGVKLPDGKEYTDNIDIKKFTDPTHPEFAETLGKVNEIRREIRRKIRQGLKL